MIAASVLSSNPLFLCRVHSLKPKLGQSVGEVPCMAFKMVSSGGTTPGSVLQIVFSSALVGSSGFLPKWKGFRVVE